ncbi:hypothetical protein L7F22_046225 [Adiantum nelumboides]|nr:hypothetical protein [Adiantum nelumboides]
MVKKKAAAQEGSSSGKDATTKVSIKPLTLLEFSGEEIDLLKQWGLTILEETSRHQIHEGIVRQVVGSFNKDNNTASVNGKELYLTLAIVEHIFKIPNAPTPKACSAKEISIYLKEKPNKKQKRKAVGQGIIVNDLPYQKAYRFAMEAVGLKNYSIFLKRCLACYWPDYNHLMLS